MLVMWNLLKSHLFLLSSRKLFLFSSRKWSVVRWCFSLLFNSAQIIVNFLFDTSSPVLYTRTLPERMQCAFGLFFVRFFSLRLFHCWLFQMFFFCLFLQAKFKDLFCNLTNLNKWERQLPFQWTHSYLNANHFDVYYWIVDEKKRWTHAHKRCHKYRDKIVGMCSQKFN